MNKNTKEQQAKAECEGISLGQYAVTEHFNVCVGLCDTIRSQAQWTFNSQTRFMYFLIPKYPLVIGLHGIP